MKLSALFVALLCSFYSFSQGVKISDTPGTPDPSAGLDVDFGDKGFLPPRIVDPESIINPATGLMVFNLTTGCIQIFNGLWQNVFCTCSGAPNQPGPVTGSTEAVICASQEYSVTAVAGASGYNWTVPAGWAITSGASTNTITIDVGFNPGAISVTAQNACGISAESILNVAIASSSPSVFSYTGSDQLFTVPDCVSSINVKAWGAGGGGFNTDKGGGGGFISATLAVTPGEQLKIIVGQGGKEMCNATPCTVWTVPTGNAYGGGGESVFQGQGGGGYSGVFRGGVLPLVIAGGGGGGGYYGDANSWGGAGGGTTGQDANASTGGHGGTQSAGGSGGGCNLGGCSTGAGSSYQGGYGNYGGGGGGGYYGGGGGGWQSSGLHRGGGGGSSYVITSGSSAITNSAGNQNTPGNTSDGAYQSGIAIGGTTGNGGNGLVQISW